MDLIKFLIYLLLFLEIYGFGFFNENHKELQIDCVDNLPLKPLLIDGFLDPIKNVYYLLTFNGQKCKKRSKSIGSPYFVINLLYQLHRYSTKT